jgi:hypothetical protein
MESSTKNGTVDRESSSGFRMRWFAEKERDSQTQISREDDLDPTTFESPTKGISK